MTENDHERRPIPFGTEPPQELAEQLGACWDRVCHQTECDVAPCKEDIEKTLDDILDLAAQAPYSQVVSLALDLLHGRLHLPGADERWQRLQVMWARGFQGVRPWLSTCGETLGLLLYSLTAHKAHAPSLLEGIVAPNDPRAWNVTEQLTVPARLRLPLHEPQRSDGPGSDFEEPRILVSGSVLRITQQSRAWSSAGRSHELRRFAAYRIDGHLFHARSARLNWKEGDEPSGFADTWPPEGSRLAPRDAAQLSSRVVPVDDPSVVSILTRLGENGDMVGLSEAVQLACRSRPEAHVVTKSWLGDEIARMIERQYFPRLGPQWEQAFAAFARVHPEWHSPIKSSAFDGKTALERAMNCLEQRILEHGAFSKR